MKKIVLSIIIAITVMVSCQKTFDYNRALPDMPQKSFVLPIEKSLELLKLVLPNTINLTRASSSEIEILRIGDFKPSTRGNNGNNCDDPIVYIVPLDNGGSAIVGADIRMQPIYAILESTTLTPDDILLSSIDSTDTDVTNMVSGMLNRTILSDIDNMNSRSMDSIILTPVDRYFYDTTTIARQAPLLRTKWHQQHPFNALCQGKPAGCVPVALAQIFYRHRWPNSLGGETFNWDLMKLAEYNYYNPTYINPTGAYEAARFIRKIGEAVQADYTSNSNLTTANPNNVLAFFRTSPFYVNLILQQYNLDKIYTMLNDSLPVITFGETSPQLDTIRGHAWVIDGYEYRQVTTYDILTNVIVNDEIVKLVHCNYGFKGNCDGYYTTGVFDLRIQRQNNELLPAIGDRIYFYDRDYSYNVKFIEYHNE